MGAVLRRPILQHLLTCTMDQSKPQGFISGLPDTCSNFIILFQFPSQIGAVLRSPTLQHLLSYTKDPVATTRFHFWVSETLQEGKMRMAYSKGDNLGI